VRIPNRRLVFDGSFTWLIPFVASLPLYGPQGEPVIPTGLFKSLMLVVGSAAGAWLLVRTFRKRPSLKRAGLSIGILWLGINVGLDLVVLVPLSKMSLPDYFSEIGLRYLVIPIMSVALSSMTPGDGEGATG
jgi:hypothetical protein